MEIVNEVVAMIRLDNLEEINTVRNALHKVVQMERKLGFKQRLLSEEEVGALQDIASSLVGYTQTPDPVTQQPQYRVIQPQALPQAPPSLEEPEMEEEVVEKKQKTKKKVGS